MFTAIDSFLQSFDELSKKTALVLEHLTDSSLQQEVAPGFRTLGEIAWHVVQTIPEMMGHTGLKVVGPSEEEAVPSSASAILQAYGKVAASLMAAIKENWTDETLSLEDEMYGEKWSRSQTCTCLIQHQIHHLGQLTVLMRQAGLTVPGICGPSKEEWALLGL